MAHARTAALRRLASAAAPAGPADPDPSLLRAFLASRSEPAFAELVRRHGPMVFAACRRVLGHAQDAEDAFQAAFIVLARKAGSVRGANVAGWLYAVAVRTARGVRIMRDRRRRKHTVSSQQSAVNSQQSTVSSRNGSPDADLLTSELVAILDEELAALPEFYRLPVVLCELQGKSRKEAAAELNVPEGTLSSRLAAAKRKLAARLARRGATASAAALTAALAGHAAARVPVHLALAATGSVPGSALAAQAADGVVKALFATQLKGMVVAVGLAVGVVGGLFATTGTGGTAVAAADAPKPVAQPAPKPDPEAAKLVKQLGDADFATREAAGKKLRDLGTKAKPALQAGARDPNPEVARRATDLLRHLRADARTDLAKSFDPAGTADYDHPVWQRYKAIVGDTPPSRNLFAGIVRRADWLRRLDAAEAGPDAARDEYRAAVREVGDRYRANLAVYFHIPIWPCDAAEEAAYLLLLGSHPGTASARPPGMTGEELRRWDEGEGRIHFARGLELGLNNEVVVLTPDNRALTFATLPGTDQVFARLLAAWLPHRDDPTALGRCLRFATQHRCAELLPFARLLAADKVARGRELPVRVYLAALGLVAQLGTPADLPLFERYFGDKTIDPTDALPPASPVKTQARDTAVALAVLLCGRDPADFGFAIPAGVFRRTVADRRPDVSRYGHHQFGFADDAARAAAHTKAKAWLADQKKAEPPTKGAKVWDHFTRVVGDDQASRELFDLIVADPKGLELLEKAAAGDKALYQAYLAQRDELNAKAEQKDPNQPGTSTIVAVPLAEAAGWLLTGTFPGTKGDDPNGPAVYFIDVELSQKPLADALKAGSPLAGPMRKLVAAWLANRGDEYSALKVGFQLALRYDIADSLPTARRVIKDFTNPKPAAGPREYTAGVLRAYGALVVGGFGTKADLPLLAPHFDDPARVLAVIRDPPGERRPGKPLPIEGKDVTCQVGDVALAMAVHLRGGDPREFGFVWPTKLDGAKVGHVFSLGVLGFRSKDDRAAAHERAKAWLAEQKKRDEK
jgi:RNA polymerase sigma factor (sigma-70 family)